MDRKARGGRGAGVVCGLGTALVTVVLAACSHSGGSSPPPTPNPASSSQVSALQALVEAGAPSNVPVDTQTGQVAAQISQLLKDRASCLGAANMLQIAENDPANSGISAQLEMYRQTQLTQAQNDLNKIQSLEGSTSAPGKAFISTDGGADLVLNTIVSKAFAAQAAVYLAAGSGAGAPSADTITAFLQSEAIVEADEGPGGHNVASQVVGQALISGTDVSTITQPEGGVP
jgi:hypothetical protein